MIEIFVVSFLVALTGALSPGPLLTFTIYKSIKQKRGYISAIFILLGHATIEFSLIIGLLAGAFFFFQDIIFLTVVGMIGGTFLVIYGIFVVRDVYKTTFTTDLVQENIKGYKGNSYIGGIVVSLSNPYWEFWWAFIGLGLLINYHVSFANPLGLILFFLGHELGDFIWYIPISIFVYLGGKSLNPKIYKYVLIICGVFMVIFGIFLIVNIIIFPPAI
ncbi:MAG: LysE family transporter [Candidatus Hodarchaeota archaeon]